MVDWLRILFPRRCAACNRVISHDEVFCHDCRTDLHPIFPPICPACGAAVDHCGCHGNQSHYYLRCVAPFYYRGAAARALVQIKHRQDADRFRWIAEEMAATVSREYRGLSLDLVCMVPMHPSRLRQREFNPAERLASELAKRLCLPFCPEALHMVAVIDGQHTLSRRFRKGNVTGAYDAVPALCKGKSVLLVDDIRTTGSTLDECAKMLQLQGAKAVYTAVAAVSDPYQTDRRQ